MSMTTIHIKTQNQGKYDVLG